VYAGSRLLAEQCCGFHWEDDPSEYMPDEESAVDSVWISAAGGSAVDAACTTGVKNVNRNIMISKNEIIIK
jgi:hypothetical protein